MKEIIEAIPASVWLAAKIVIWCTAIGQIVDLIVGCIMFPFVIYLLSRGTASSSKSKIIISRNKAEIDPRFKDDE